MGWGEVVNSAHGQESDFVRAAGGVGNSRELGARGQQGCFLGASSEERKK